MHLLLTRPQGRNQSLADALARLGYQTTQAPMMALVSNPNAGPNPLSNADGIIFISITAVQYALPHLSQAPLSCPIYAVGNATARALRQAGYDPICPPLGAETSEGLLQLLATGPRDGQNWVIVRGVGGREALAQGLTLLGANVSYWELYQRLPSTNVSQTQLQGWRNGGLNAILATSGEIIENLFTSIPSEQHAWLKQCLWLVPVDRVAKLAKARGCQNVWITDGASDDAIIRCLTDKSSHGEYAERSLCIQKTEPKDTAKR